MPLNSDEPFAQLIREFAVRSGFSAAEIATSEGIEFEADGFVARLIAHPHDRQLLIAEVDVAQTDPQDPQQQGLAWMLHQINHAARFEHEWVAHIDADNVLMMSTTSRIRDLTVEGAQQLLADAVSRADALAHLWTSGLQSDEAPETTVTPGSIRG